MFILPYKIGSRSAKLLAQKLNVKRSRGVKIFRPRTKIINWGNTQANIRGRNLTVINKPQNVALASNKLSSMQTLSSAGVSIVEFTTNRTIAQEWQENGNIVYCRTILNGHSGRGIVIVQDDSQIMPVCQLYTKGVGKAHEFRVHIAFNRVIDFSKKKRRSNSETTSGLIKNLDNGWVFCRSGVSLPDSVKNEAIKAVQALGLDFGAVDVIFKERDNKAYVLEVNTAPGLEGTTLEKYYEALR